MSLLLPIAIVLFLYPFAIYPVVLGLATRRVRRIDRIASPGEYPAAALVICALNEEKIIRQKIENSLELEYPGPLRIVVVSDGSTDRTAAIAQEYASARLEVIERKTRRGKVANLNAVIPELNEEVAVLSDANVIYERDAVLRLVTRLESDAAIGCVSGKVILTETVQDLRRSEESYYSLEWTLQERASALYSMVGADGAMYALRKRLFVRCPDDTIIEDLILPVAIVRQGYRVVFEPRAVGWESGVTSVTEEFRRKTRIAAGAAQALLRGNAWPRGAPGRFWFVFVSHKLLRWLSPIVGATALMMAVLAWQRPLSAIVLAGFALLAAAAAARWATGRAHAALDAPFYFLFGQYAMLWGLLKGAAGKQSVLWKKLDR